MLYESVMTPSISANIANMELVVLFAIFYKSLFGRFEIYKKSRYHIVPSNDLVDDKSVNDSRIKDANGLF